MLVMVFMITTTSTMPLGVTEKYKDDDWVEQDHSRECTYDITELDKYANGLLQLLLALPDLHAPT